MPLNKEEMREYMRKRRLGERKKVEVEEWDRKKYPKREAWEEAVMRSERARVYAEKFPEQVRMGEERFSEVGWQYMNENGVKEEVRLERPAVVLVKRVCEKCKGEWSSSVEMLCPYCDGSGKRVRGLGGRWC